MFAVLFILSSTVVRSYFYVSVNMVAVSSVEILINFVPRLLYKTLISLKT